MRLLWIEDNVDLVNVVKERLQEEEPELEIVHAASRDSGKAQVEIGHYDVVICDLSIPTTDGALDQDVAHGLDVYETVKLKASGTTCIVLSAFLNVGLTGDLFSSARSADMFGTGREQLLLHVVEKKDLPKVIKLLKNMAGALRELDDIEIVCDAGCALDLSQRRVVKIFAHMLGGHGVRVANVSGGMSGTRAVSIRVLGERGDVRTVALGKVGPIDDVENEHARGRQYVTPLLAVGTCVSDLRIVRAGAGPLGGIFYPFADEYSETLYARIGSHPEEARQLIERIRALESRWQGRGTVESVSVADVRRFCVADEHMSSLMGKYPGFRLADAEARRVQIMRCVQHGDLHGGNVLLKPDGSPLVIDYARAQMGTAALDPLTLELSLLYHPDGRQLAPGWPSPATAANWSDIDAYVVGCPVADVVRECRAWASAMANSPRELYAVAYAVSLRQLRYPDTDVDVARAVIESALRGIRSA